MRLLVMIAGMCLFVDTCLGQQLSMELAGRELMICYKESARLYAKETCEPSASLVEAVFGRCTLEEDVLRRAVVSEKKYVNLDADTSGKLADSIVARIKDKQRGALQSIILDTRIVLKKACPVLPQSR
jgi:hypothetical protein